MNKVPTLLGDYCRQRRCAPNTTAVKPLQPLELRVGSSSVFNEPSSKCLCLQLWWYHYVATPVASCLRMIAGLCQFYVLQWKVLFNQPLWVSRDQWTSQSCKFWANMNQQAYPHLSVLEQCCLFELISAPRKANFFLRGGGFMNTFPAA